MSLKRTLLAIAATILLLLPVGRLLRDQNPWTCFPFTFDESYFAQAASQWSEGHGYRVAEGTPFDPSITVGIPMAWGASALNGLTGYDIATSGRLFVFLCFIGLILTLARTVYKIDRNWFSVLATLGFFGYGLSKVSFGPYFAFGFLGEMPAFLLGALAYRALDEKRFFRAGLLAVGVFVMQPTFLFFLPAVGIAALLHSGKAGLKAGVSIATSLGLIVFGITRARNQALGEYLSTFLSESTRIAHFSPKGTPLDHYGDFKNLAAVYSGAFLVFGAYTTARARKISPSQVAAFFLFLGASTYFFVLNQRPVEKQWSAIFSLTLLGFAVPWGTLVGNWFAGWTSRELTRAIVLAVVLGSTLSVAHDVLHKYKRTPETACPSKEQSAINKKVRTLSDSGELTRENFGAWVDTHPHKMSIYRLPWTIQYQTSRRDLGAELPKWLYGETKNLLPLPSGCASVFQGETFALLKCEKQGPVRRR